VIKQIFLPLVAVAVFIVAVGLFVKNSGKKTVTIGNKTISVEVANTPESRKNGLSGTSALAEDNGMLFVFDSQDIMPSFWMKDMLIPLDIIWINDGKVVKIDKNVPAPAKDIPDSELKTHNPGQPIDYVLEVNSGFSDKNGVKAGDSVTLPSL